jgi:hypothetical protein
MDIPSTPPHRHTRRGRCGTPTCPIHGGLCADPTWCDAYNGITEHWHRLHHSTAASQLLFALMNRTLWANPWSLWCDDTVADLAAECHRPARKVAAAVDELVEAGTFHREVRSDDAGRLGWNLAFHEWLATDRKWLSLYLHSDQNAYDANTAPEVLAWVERFMAGEIEAEWSVRPFRYWLSVRVAIFARDGYRCHFCGQQYGDLNCTHGILPSRGGRTHVSNLITACASCARSKHAKTPAEWQEERAEKAARAAWLAQFPRRSPDGDLHE